MRRPVAVSGGRDPGSAGVAAPAPTPRREPLRDRALGAFATRLVEAGSGERVLLAHWAGGRWREERGLE